MYFPAQIYNDIMKEVLTHVAPHGYSRQFFSLINYNAQEVNSIARTSAPINVIVHYPKTEEGKRELAIRVASVHADMVNPTHQPNEHSFFTEGTTSGCDY